MKWCTTENEEYAIYHTVKTFFPYLFGTTFTIEMDHASLKYLMCKRKPTGRSARCSLYLQQFAVEIHYRPGKLHQNADALSRSPVYATQNISSTIGSSHNKKISFAKYSSKNTPEKRSRITSGKKIPLKFLLMACWPLHERR